MTYGNLSKTNLTDKVVLILGGGYLGKKISTHLNSLGAAVHIHTTQTCNYHDRKTFWRSLLYIEPDIVINCSGFTGRPNIDEAESRKEECWNLNVRSPLQVAELCNQLGIRHIHISSGCIYDGYEKNFTEEDVPNFGLWDTSSTYSKTKHAFEYLSKEYPSKILRIRMPISGDNDRCYLSKIKKYDKLIDFVNSKTYIPDLCNFVVALMENKDILWKEQDIYNIVNPEPLTTSKVCELMFLGKDHNPNWEFVALDKIPIAAPRSNCILDNSKANTILPLRTELEALIELYGLDHLQLGGDLLD